MPPIQGVNVTGTLVPYDTSDTFPVTDPWWGIDGQRTVASSIERDAIPSLRRREGMWVYTQSSQSYWRLKPEPWTDTAADWLLVPMIPDPTSQPGSILTTNGTAVQWSALGDLLTNIGASLVRADVVYNDPSWLGSITQATVTGLTDALNAKANDSNTVHISGVETIRGTKTFDQPVNCDITGSAGSFSGTIQISQVSDLQYQLDHLGNSTTAVRTYTLHFRATDLVSGTLTVTHAFDNQYNLVLIMDEEGSQVEPNGISFTDANSLVVDLNHITITNSWTALVVRTSGSTTGGGGGGSGTSSNIWDLGANRPAPGAPGIIFTPLDGVFPSIDTGTRWAPLIAPLAIFPPLLATWTLLDADDHTHFADTPGGGLMLAVDPNDITAQSYLRGVTTPAVSPFTATIACRVQTTIGIIDTGGTHSHIGLTISDGTRLIVWGVSGAIYGALSATQFSTNGAPAHDYYHNAPMMGLPDILWLRIVDNDTGRTFLWSTDGIYWITAWSTAASDYLTTTVVGVAVDVNSAEDGGQLHLIGWNLTSP